MTTKQDILFLAKKGAHPSDIAAALGCTTEYARKTFYRNGLTWEHRRASAGNKRRSPRSIAWDDRDPILKECWGKIPSSEIAVRLGLSKNAVIGRAHRLGLENISGRWSGPTKRRADSHA
jgi:hypothetical protein